MNANAFGVEIRARCHGAEDYYKVVFPYRIEGDPLAEGNDHIRMAMNAFCPFDPTKVIK